MRNSNNNLNTRSEIEAGYENPDSQSFIECFRAVMKAQGFQHKSQTWFVELDLDSNITVEINGWSFYVHKFPVL